jgi:chromosome partitioning protein
MQVLIFSALKGGVGKSSTTVNVAACLSKLGYKVLILDLDSQGSASIYLGIQPASTNNLDINSIADYFYRDSSVLDCIESIEFTNISIARGSSEMGLLDMFLAKSKEHWYLEVSNLINNVKNQYDFILLDTPPSLNAITINSLIAADHIIIVTPPLSLDANSLYQLLSEINNIRELAPVGIFEGVLLTRVRNYRTMLAHKKYLRQEFGDLVFSNEITESVVIPESSANKLDVLRYKPRSSSSKQYLNFTKELLIKILV